MVFDSLNSESDCELQLAFPDQGARVLSGIIPAVQKQKHGGTYGLFAIAFAHCAKTYDPIIGNTMVKCEGSHTIA